MSLDAYGLEAPPPDLYDYRATATTSLDGFDAVRDADIARFHELGFLVIRDALDSPAIETARRGLRELILRRDADNIMFEAIVGERFDDLPDDERLDSVRKLMPIAPFDARLKATAAHPGLLEVVERIMGETPTLAQDMALLKPPRIGREKPWHQDMAYFDFPAGTPIVGAWIALDEALPENGCMMLVPGSHRDGPMPHWTRRDWQICDSDARVAESVAVPLAPGGCLLFHCLLHHGTPQTRSNRRRWALQFHYRPASVAALPSSDERLRIFGGEGSGATC